MNETLNIQNGVSPITIDTEVTEGSTRPVMGGGIYEAIAGVVEPFVVNLTPTDPYLTAGTMDKTVGEIYAAWLEGRRIRFALSVEGIGAAYWEAILVAFVGSTYPSFNATGLTSARGADELMFFFTGITDDATVNTWGASFFPLTPSE